VSHDGLCEGGIRLTLSSDVPTRGLALVFETGSYSLSDGALRYRRGAAGRQPLTEAIIDDGDLEPAHGGFGARIRFSLDSLSGTDPVERSLRVLLRNGITP
jgi:hypothetical protein